MHHMATASETGEDRVAFAALLRDQRSGHTLDAAFYLDAGIFQAEMAGIFRRHWVFAGHGCEIARSGDFLLYKLGDEQIIVTRDEAGTVRAFHNSCRHRGSTICDQERGQVRRFVCPYHAWTYGLDGRLLGLPAQMGDIDKSAHGLKPVQAEEIFGLVFINLSPQPDAASRAAIDALRAHYAPILAPQKLATAKVAKIVDYDLPVNWKTIVENNRECFHCPSNHPLYLSVTYDVEGDQPAKLMEIAARLTECRARWSGMGLDVSRVNISSDYTSDWFRANRTPVRQGCVTESADGQPVAPLMAGFSDPDMGTARANTNVNFWCHANSDYANTVRITPVSAERTIVRSSWLVDADAVEGRDYDIDKVMAVHHTTMSEDWQICRRQAAGIRSSGYQPGPLSPQKEANVIRFLDWYLATLRTTVS